MRKMHKQTGKQKVIQTDRQRQLHRQAQAWEEVPRRLSCAASTCFTHTHTLTSGGGGAAAAV